MTEALLLSAGRGERLRPLTDARPKALVSDGDTTLLDRHLSALRAAGVTRVVINLGWLGEQIVEHVGDGRRYGLAIVFSPEGYPTLDTGGAVRQALNVMADAPFWVVNADVHTDFAFDVAPQTLLAGRDATIGLVPNPDYRSSGDFGLREGLATNDGEDLLTFSGIACYRPRFFAHTRVERFSIVPMLRDAARAAALGGFALQANWFDVGTPERLAHVRQIVAGD